MEDNNSVKPLAVMPRHSWQAMNSKHLDSLSHPVQFVFCMNTHTTPCNDERTCRYAVRHVQIHHMNRQSHRDIRYNFIIGGDGNVYEGRGWQHRALLPEKYKEYNDKSIVIGFIGEYTEVDLPAIMTLRRNELVSYGVKQNYISSHFQPFEIFDRKHR